MGFGIEITGADGTNNANTFIVQDTDLNMINYQISAIGAGSSVAVPGGKSRVFVNGNYSGSTGEFISKQTTSGTHYFYKHSRTVDSQGTITAFSISAANVNYIVLSQMDQISNSGGNYGIQLFTSGGTVAFDSRRCNVNDSFFVNNSHAPRTISSRNPVSGANGAISTTLNNTAYIDAELLYVEISNNGSEVYESAVKWNSSGVNPQLQYSHTFTLGIGVNFIGQTSYLQNFQTIVLGKDR